MSFATQAAFKLISEIGVSVRRCVLPATYLDA